MSGTAVSIPATRWADISAIATAAGARDHWWRSDTQRLYALGCTQAALEAAATPDRLSPPPQGPDAVAAWAAKAVLEDAGLLAAAQVAAEAAGAAWKWRFLQATQWERARVLELSDALSLTPAQVDALLIQAAALEAEG